VNDVKNNTCSKCGFFCELAAGNFSRKTGERLYRSWCVSCEKKRKAKWVQDNIEHVLEKTKNYHKAHPEIPKRAKEKWASNNKDHLRQLRKEWRHNNKDKVLANQKKYREKIKLAVRLWRKRNPQKVKAHSKVFIELRAGRLKKLPCFCGEVKSEAHHPDYTKPLMVEWLCKKHHVEADIQLMRFQ